MSKSKQDKVLNQINATIYKTNNTRNALYSFKNKFSIEVIAKYFTTVISLPKFSNIYIKNLNFKHTSDLCKDMFLHPTTGLWKELAWNVLVLNTYHKV